MLVNCNALSQVHLQKATAEFKKHVQLLNEVKKDLENIFKRVKIMKAKAAAQYPHQFEGCRPLNFIMRLTSNHNCIFLLSTFYRCCE